MKCRKKWCRAKHPSGTCDGWRRGFCPKHAAIHEMEIDTENWDGMICPWMGGISIALRNKHRQTHPVVIQIPQRLLHDVAKYIAAIDDSTKKVKGRDDPMDHFIAPKSSAR